MCRFLPPCQKAKLWDETWHFLSAGFELPVLFHIFCREHHRCLFLRAVPPVIPLARRSVTDSAFKPILVLWALNKHCMWYLLYFVAFVIGPAVWKKTTLKHAKQLSFISFRLYYRACWMDASYLRRHSTLKVERWMKSKPGIADTKLACGCD